MRRLVQIATVPGLLASITYGQTLGQATTNVTCVSQTSWMTNSVGQNPCLVSAWLSGVCNDGTWFVPTLLAEGPYNPPQGSSAQIGATECRCNTVVYNLLQGCSVCQGGIIGSWADWISFCNASVVSKGYPESVPDGTTIPGWAELDPTETGTWNATEAQDYADGNTSGAPPTTSSGASSSSSHKSSNTGAIVGGVVGGIAALVILGLLAWFLLRRNRESKGEKVTPIPYNAGNAGGIDHGYNNAGYVEKDVPHRTDLGTPAPPTMLGSHGMGMPMRTYDPSDPSTFPTTPDPATSLSHDRHTPLGGFSAYPSGGASPQPYSSPNSGTRPMGAYTGAAEV